MSGYPSSNDIEDVVSSVRRLVSVDGRTRLVSRGLDGERLLLTPALQVVADSGPAVEERTPQAVDEDTVPDVTALAASVDFAPTPEVTGAPETGETATEPVLAVAAESLPPAPKASGPADQAEEVAAPDPAAVPDTDIQDVLANADLADSGTNSPPPPKEVPEALHLIEEEWEDELWAESDPSLAELALGVEEAELVPLVAEPTPRQPAAALGPDAARAQVDDDWADDLPDPVVPFAAHRARVQPPEPVAAPPLGEAVELTDTDGNPLTILDEAALQEVVRQMIREELQGSLGERITRNVRKLVRAEINRALTARALD